MHRITATKALGTAIRVCRKSSGLTQAQAAAVCGVGIRFLSELENGKTTAHIGKVLKVITGLGLDLHLVPRGRDANIAPPVTALKLETYKATINRATDALTGGSRVSERNPSVSSEQQKSTAAEQVAGLRKKLFPDD